MKVTVEDIRRVLESYLDGDDFVESHDCKHIVTVTARTLEQVVRDYLASLTHRPDYESKVRVLVLACRMGHEAKFDELDACRRQMASQRNSRVGGAA